MKAWKQYEKDLAADNGGERIAFSGARDENLDVEFGGFLWDAKAADTQTKYTITAKVWEICKQRAGIRGMLPGLAVRMRGHSILIFQQKHIDLRRRGFRMLVGKNTALKEDRFTLHIEDWLEKAAFADRCGQPLAFVINFHGYKLVGVAEEVFRDKKMAVQ